MFVCVPSAPSVHVFFFLLWGRSFFNDTLLWRFDTRTEMEDLFKNDFFFLNFHLKYFYFFSPKKTYPLTPIR